MRTLSALVKRNLKETLRDSLSLIFCILFPVVMLVFMQVMFGSMEYTPSNFRLENYAPGICVFGYTFTSLLTAISIASDKNTSMIRRIEIAPSSRITYLLSFLVAGIPVALIQTIIFFAIAIILGLPFEMNTVFALINLIPSFVFYISLGILIGMIGSNEKQVGPISSIFISLSCMLGGVFMPVEIFTGGFRTFVDLLPFVHTVQISGLVYTNGAFDALSHVFPLLAYIVGIWCTILLIHRLCDR